MPTVERVADERVVVIKPTDKDAVFVYKIRYTSIVETDEEDRLIETRWRSEYGGITGAWTEYKPLDKLDMDAPGVLTIDGIDWMRLRDGVRRMDADERAWLLSGRDAIDRVLDAADID